MKRTLPLICCLLFVSTSVRGEQAIREMGLLPPPQGDLLGFRNPGDVPAAPPDGELIVQKIAPADCRVVLGAVHSPVDGRVDSWGYNGVVQEYDNSQGYHGGHWQNVTYEYLKNPGVHVTLADDAGFNYLELRGGFIGTVYRDVDALEGPGTGKLVLRAEASTGPEGPGHFRIGRYALPQTVKTKRVSLFREDRLLSDAAFYRIGSAAIPADYTRTTDFFVGDVASDLASLGVDFVQLPAQQGERHPSNFHRRFFRAEDRTVRGLRSARGEAVKLAAAQQVHLITPAWKIGQPVGAVRVDLKLDGVPDGNLVHLAVQDPVTGNQELLRITVRAASGGRVRCLLDFPDVLMPADGRIWLTLASEHAGTLAADSTIGVLEVPEHIARPQHLAYRLLLLKGYFYVLSEARPWNGRPMSLAWLLENDGAEWNVQRVRPQLIDLYRTMEHLRAVAPDHPIAVGQYAAWLDRSRRAKAAIETPELPEYSGVPRWAVLLDRAAASVVAIPNWWVTHRMAPNGELGGCLGDDTDMLQWWIPSALLDSEEFLPKARDVFQRINGLVLKHNLRDGVNLKTTDALHAYEEGINHNCLMPLLFYGEPQHIEQLMAAAKSVEKWMMPTERGLRFRTNDFGWSTAQKPPQPPDDRVSDNSALMLHPHLMLAWWNGDPRALDTITKYLADCGDQVPYAYGGGMTLNFGAYWLTGDSKYLHLPAEGRDADGNPWARFHPEFPAHGKEAREQPWWPGYVQKIGRMSNSGDWAWATAQNRKILEESLLFDLFGNPGTKGGGAERFRYMWTEAEQFTDRVFLPVETVAQAMLGGYNVRNRLWPGYAVSYEKLSGDFAALVLEQGRDRLKLAMVNLRPNTRRGAFRVWQLDHGRYELVVGPDANDDGQPDSVERRELLALKRMDAVPVELPPRKLVVYQLRQTEKLDDVYARADLAIAAPDVVRHGDKLKVTVHNIGRAAAKDFSVALADAQGKPLARHQVQELAPPRDLTPSRLTVELPLPPNAATIRIDADDAVPELSEANNTVAVR